MSSPDQKPAPRPTIKAVRGTRDLLPDQTPLWNRVESTARAVFNRYGFAEIRTPIFEETSLFSRAVGEETDIVGKEMFTWEDGERFDKERMKEVWKGKNHYAQTTDIIGRWMEVSNFGEGGVTLVDFAGRHDQEAIQRLASLELSSLKKPIYRRILVISSAANRQTDEVIDGVEIQYLQGNFTKSSQSLTLRPESTAGVVRAYIEHKLGETGQLQKLYYIGPQFRRERPQRGRYRQFWQIGAEVIGPQTSGAESPIRDAEVLEMLASLLDELGIRDWRLELNSVGNSEDRARYNVALREALAPIKDQLCPDNQRRAETNPLRVLDSKDEADQDLINALPKIADYLGPDSSQHFAEVLKALDACGVKYHLNPRLVRGLDYYTRTTFEFTVTTGLGTQNALLGGGRYDGLSEMLGGPKAPGIGFAIGEDRLILTLQAQAEQDAAKSGAPHLASEMWVTKLDAYIAPIGPAHNAAALALAKYLRREGFTIEVGDGKFKLGKSFDTADKLARHIILLGEDEAISGILTVKRFATGEQSKVARAELTEALRKL